MSEQESSKDRRKYVARFGIGAAFPHDDYLAVWITSVAMMLNDGLLAAAKSIRTAAPNYERAYFVRLSAAHLWEGAVFYSETRAHAKVVAILEQLPADRKQDFERVVAVLEQDDHPLRAAVLRARNCLFHYPEADLVQVARGREELQRALRRCAEQEGVVEFGERFGDTRAWFADDVALTLMLEVEPEEEEAASEAFLAGLVEAVNAQMRAAEALLAIYLRDLPSGVLHTEPLGQAADLGPKGEGFA